MDVTISITAEQETALGKYIADPRFTSTTITVDEEGQYTITKTARWATIQAFFDWQASQILAGVTAMFPPEGQ